MKLDEIIKKIGEFPPLPAVTTKLLKLLNEQDSSTNDIIKTVSLDALLTTKLLKLCNSPLYGFRREITSVNRAVVLLGRKTITNLVISICCSKQYEGSQEGYVLDSGSLWKHSVSNAFASELLADKIGYQDTSLLFTASLLQDIGKILLDSYIKENISRLDIKINENNKAFHEIEKEILGYHHGEIGAELLKHWNFPDIIIDSVRYHHEPKDAKIDKKLAYLVQLSDYLSTMLGIGVGIDGLQYRVNLDDLSIFNLSAQEIQMILIQLTEQMSKIESFLSL